MPRMRLSKRGAARGRAPSLVLQVLHHLLHGREGLGDVVVDASQEGPSLPHRCHLQVQQDDVVVFVDLYSTQQELYGEERN